MLTKPPDSFPHLPERAYSVREIVQMYLKPPAGSSSVLGKTLRAHWPDEKRSRRLPTGGRMCREKC